MRSNQKGRILAAKGGVFPPKNSWSNGDLRERETERERERDWWKKARALMKPLQCGYEGRRQDAQMHVHRRRKKFTAPNPGYALPPEPELDSR